MVTACLNPDGTLSVLLLNQGDKKINYQLNIGESVANVSIDAQTVQTVVLN